MKTREAIQLEYQNNAENLFVEYGDRIRELTKVRDAALAELDDPMARLIAAARNVLADQIARDPEHDRLCLICRRISNPDSRMLLFHNQDCSAADLRDAIAYAEQRRVTE
jgi:hypothetical protein